MKPFVVDMRKCTGCRSCELACSYHHSGAFNPRRASLFIKRSERNGEIRILFYHELSAKDMTNRYACNGCRDEDDLQCVTYCAFGAIDAVRKRKEGA